jgi:CBS domain-containing protein
MKCREIMTTNPICCLPEETVGQVARIMRREHVASLPVISDERSRMLVGIITNRDLVTKVVAESRGPNQTEIAEVMTRTIFACRADDDIDSAIAAMDEHDVRHVPIIDREGSILGIISHGDLRTLPWRRPFGLMREVFQAA